MIPRTTVDLGNEERNAIERVLSSGQYVKGQEAELLEEEFAQYQQVEFAATVNSGTSALHLSLLALNIKNGDEVIIPPNTFAATVNAIIFTGAKPIFVDINPNTFLIDSTKLEKKINMNTKAIIPVHLYGLMCEMEKIQSIAQKNNIYIIEDACQAHGAACKGKKAGVQGDLAAFSFFPTKNTTVGGDGGIVISNNEELILKIKALRDHGRINGQHVMPGLNNRLSEILAAIGRSHLKKLDKYNQNRRDLASCYEEKLRNLFHIELPTEPPNFKHVYHLYTIKAEKRDELQKYLKKNNIGSSVMYKEKLNELNYIKEVAGYQKMPINDEISEKILSIPISGTYSKDKIRFVCEKIIEFYS
ncbi:MAG: DegT/DnrJ/EryC1/StrS family aminotransferase [Candidatus Lokiarchaeota archaeon]|nr:DegT/DnrJ/EryC1/StrS family aminotransferase [Candidatus Lokiarchaeota archaeon]